MYMYMCNVKWLLSVYININLLWQGFICYGQEVTVPLTTHPPTTQELTPLYTVIFNNMSIFLTHKLSLALRFTQEGAHPLPTPLHISMYTVHVYVPSYTSLAYVLTTIQ